MEPKLRSATKAELRAALVERRPDDHKGVYGHVLIAAGSRGMAGAAILAARAALRSGAGLVTVAVPKGVAPVVAGAVPSAMTLALPEDAAGAFSPAGVSILQSYAREKRITALAIGPGVTTRPGAARFVLGVLSGVALPAVVDADALNIVAASPRGIKRANAWILTPHPGEMARLLKIKTPKDEPSRLRAVERLARERGAVALLKGRRTLISDGDRTVVNATGGTALAKGGSGDVLTGLLAGLWAQALASGRARGDAAFRCAALAAWLHGTAGELAGRERTPWASVSSDLPEYLPKAFRAL